MTDEATPEVAAPAESAPAPAPAAPAFDPEQFKASLMGEIDTRIKGFQRLVAERDEEIRTLKTASLSEDEQEQLAIQEEEQRIAALEAENELLKLQGKYPKGVSRFQEILSRASTEEQVAFLEAFAEAQAAAAEQEAADLVSDVDPNNPAGNKNTGMPGAGGMTDELSMEILKRVSKATSG